MIEEGPHRLRVTGTSHPVELPASSTARRVIAALLRGEHPPTDPPARRVIDTLAPVLLDGRGLLPPELAPGDAASAAVADPEQYATRLARRSQARIAVRGSLGVDPEPLLRAAGLREAEPGRPAHAVLVFSPTEPERSEFDPLLDSGITHLVVRANAGVLTLGPLVVPGRTPCLRCLDAHLGQADPGLALRLVRHAQAERRDGAAEPLDLARAHLATAWAVRDLVTHLDGGSPATLAATVCVPADLSDLTVLRWRRHPDCGCAWLNPG